MSSSASTDMPSRVRPDSAVEIQYRDRRYQSETARTGMWLFLASEMLFFGALLLTWGFYRVEHASDFAEATRETEFAIGTANTVVLLTSSFAFASAVAFARRGYNRRVMWASVITGLLGIIFLGLKGLEWYKDIVNGDLPGPAFHAPGAEGGAQLFWMFYWIGTGLHGLHLLVGIGLVFWIAWRAAHGAFRPETAVPVEVVGLYWSFVDMVWLVLYPLIYLAGRAA